MSIEQDASSDDRFYSLPSEDQSTPVHDEDLSVVNQWLTGLCLTEFSQGSGHQLRYTWPSSLFLNADERSRLAVETMPETNVHADDEIAFAMKFRRDCGKRWFSARAASSETMSGVAIAFAEGCNEAQRGVRHYAVTTLYPHNSPMTPELAAFICRAVILEAHSPSNTTGVSYSPTPTTSRILETPLKGISMVAVNDQGSPLTSSAIRSSREQSFQNSINVVYKGFAEAIDKLISHPSRFIDICVPHEDLGMRRYRTKVPTAFIPGPSMVCNPSSFRSTPDGSSTLMTETHSTGYTSFTEEYLLADLQFELKLLLDHLPLLWEHCVLGRSLLVLGPHPGRVSSFVLFLAKITSLAGFSGDLRPYMNSMSRDYADLTEYCHDHRQLVGKRTAVNDSSLPDWLMDAGRHLLSSSQKAVHDAAHRGGALADSLALMGTSIDQLGDILEVEAITLPRQVIVGSANPMCLQNLKPFQCTIVFNMPIFSTPTPNKADKDYVPVVLRRKHGTPPSSALDHVPPHLPSSSPVTEKGNQKNAHTSNNNMNDSTTMRTRRGLNNPHHSWIGSAHRTLLGLKGACWLKERVLVLRTEGSDRQTGGSDYSSNGQQHIKEGGLTGQCGIVEAIGLALLELTQIFMTPFQLMLNRRAHDLGRQILESDPLRDPIHPLYPNDDASLDEDLFSTLELDKFIKQLDGLVRTPPFSDLDTSTKASLYGLYLKSPNFQSWCESFNTTLNNELRTLRLRQVLAMKAHINIEDKRRRQVLKILCESQAFFKLNTEEREAISCHVNDLKQCV